MATFTVKKETLLPIENAKDLIHVLTNGDYDICDSDNNYISFDDFCKLKYEI